MDVTWSRRETQLWSEIHATPLTDDSARGRRLLRLAKARGVRGKDLEDFREAHGIISSEQATARSWAAYKEWIKH